MSRQAQVTHQEKEVAKEELKELEKEKATLEEDLDKALEKGENAENNEDAAKQNTIADNIESDIEDLDKEIAKKKDEAVVPLMICWEDSLILKVIFSLMVDYSAGIPKYKDKAGVN
ncbi:unnamed protein product [Adineta ricciae]|uniref:Uncharacterized protein n=1 Tax=Adineta ricciae TaxID=249248 RepID=A0A815IB78_ADIRI|nr:unnamed protein product [Adineta ricciae]